MSVVARLRDLLDRERVPYEVLAHSPIAKVVAVRHGDTLSLAVLPAVARVDLDRLGAALRTRVELAPEPEIAAAFPDCETGAVPPFGALYGLKTYVDESLTHDRHVVFNAGTHVESIRMAFEDYRRIAAPIVLWFAESPARAEG